MAFLGVPQDEGYDTLQQKDARPTRTTDNKTKGADQVSQVTTIAAQ